MRSIWRSRLLPCCLIVGGSTYLWSLSQLSATPRTSMTQEMQVALPPIVQVLTAGGDRFLAANIDTWRSLVASTEHMQSDNFRVQGQLQVDASWLNPRNQDNYWVAAAILPWNGQVEQAQTVLRRASATRPYDWQPQFYYAFGLYYFYRDPVSAAAWLRDSTRGLTSEEEKYMLEAIAAHWYERRFDPDVAIRYLEEMAKTARSSGFRAHLMLRAERMRALQKLRTAAQRFTAVHGQPPAKLDDLVSSGILKALPADPFGLGFKLDRNGVPDTK